MTISEALQAVGVRARIVDTNHKALLGPWVSIFARPQSEWKSLTLDLWTPFRQLLPKFTARQRRSLVEIAPILDEGLLEVAYLYNDGRYDYLHVGGMPLLEQGRMGGLENFPGPLSRFYRELHDGYGLVRTAALGPLPRRELRTLDDIDNGDRLAEYEPCEEKVVVLWNGGPGYLVLDVKSQLGDQPDALMWWTDEPPDRAPFWPSLDAFMEVGVSELDE
jgi:hypothetical protein